MIDRRIVVNLCAFLVLSAALIAYGFFDLLGNPLAHETTVSTIVPSAAGLSPDFDVTLDGVDVGIVKSVSLVPRGAKVTMTLDPGKHVPSNVQALVAIENPLGEQEVELVPKDPKGADPAPQTTADIRNGAVIPAAPDSAPAQVGTVVAEATKLLQSIPAGSLDDLLHEAAVALNGNVGSLRTIASASELFSEEFLAQQQQFETLLANAPPVLDAVNQNAAALQQGLVDTAVLVEVFARHADDLTRLFSQGSNASAALNELLSENEPNLACIVHDSSDIDSNVGSQPALSNVSTVLSTNQEFFGAVNKLTVTGPAVSLNANDSARNNQEWLRVRMLIPGLQIPASSPQPIEYSTPTKLPPVLPPSSRLRSSRHSPIT